MDKYYSVALKPGTFGKTMYNAAFKEFGIDAEYVPEKVESRRKFRTFVRSAFEDKNTKGISVSMPFKRAAAQYTSSDYTNVNTIIHINDDFFSGLLGYNTDIHGFKKMYKSIVDDTKAKTVLVFGMGAVSESVVDALKGKNIYILRAPAKPEALSMFDKIDVLINATPIGMEGIKDTFFRKELLQKCKYVLDVVIGKKPTSLIKKSTILGIPCQSGAFMCVHQLSQQFKIYTGQEPPMDLFWKLLKKEGYFYV